MQIICIFSYQGSIIDLGQVVDVYCSSFKTMLIFLQSSFPKYIYRKVYSLVSLLCQPGPGRFCSILSVLLLPDLNTSLSWKQWDVLGFPFFFLQLDLIDAIESLSIIDEAHGDFLKIFFVFLNYPAYISVVVVLWLFLKPASTLASLFPRRF